MKKNLILLMKRNQMKYLKKVFPCALFWLWVGTSFSQMPIPYPDETHLRNNKKIKCLIREKTIPGSPSEVFAFMDDIRNTGMHMTSSNSQMMGSKLEMKWLSQQHTGLGTKYQWTGKVMGMEMDFTVEVTHWMEGREKVWETVGNEAEMIVIDWFRMFLTLTETEDGNTRAELGILYTKPKGRLWAFLLGRRYSVWCVKSMLKDTRKHFKEEEKTHEDATPPIPLSRTHD
jgi:hypothetical protein